MQPKRKWFLAIFAVALPLDQLTKLWIIERFHYGQSLTVIPGFFDITHVRNPGGAFSLFAGGDPDLRLAFFLTAGAVAVVGEAAVQSPLLGVEAGGDVVGSVPEQ